MLHKNDNMRNGDAADDTVYTWENLQCKAAAQGWLDWWKPFLDIEDKLQWRSGLKTRDLKTTKKQQHSCKSSVPCIIVCTSVFDLTLKKGRDDVTVHQGFDVVLSAHGQAAEHYGTLRLQLQAGRALLEQVK